MKCDNCLNMKFHSAGNFYAVAEGGDDPYNYHYCSKGHWCDDPFPDKGDNESIWDSCVDYLDKKELSMNAS